MSQLSIKRKLVSFGVKSEVIESLRYELHKSKLWLAGISVSYLEVPQCDRRYSYEYLEVSAEFARSFAPLTVFVTMKGKEIQIYSKWWNWKDKWSLPLKHIIPEVALKRIAQKWAISLSNRKIPEGLELIKEYPTGYSNDSF